MLTKGSHFGGNTWIEIPRKSSSAVSNILHKRGYDELSNQSVRNHHLGPSTGWRYHPSMRCNRSCLKRKISKYPSPVCQNAQYVSILEVILLTNASSKEEYMNMKTFNQRLEAILHSLNFFDTGYNGVPVGGLSNPSIVHDLHCFNDGGSSMPPLTDMDVLCNLPVSRGRSNLDANIRSLSNYNPQQHANNKLDFQRNFTVRHNVNNVPSGDTETILLSKRQKMKDLDFNGPLINNPSFDQRDYMMVQPYSSQTFPEKQQQSNMSTPVEDASPTNIEYIESATEFWTNAETKVDEPTSDQEKQTKSSIKRVTEKKNYVIYASSRDTLESKMIPLKGIGPGQISEKIYSTPTLCKEVIIISDDDDEEEINGRTGFNQEGINAQNQFREQKDDHQKQSKCSNTTVNELNNNVVVESFGQTFKTDTFLSKDLEASQISVEQDHESHDVIDSSEPMDIDIGLDSNMHALISNVPSPIILEDKQDGSGFDQEDRNAKKKVSEPKADQEKQTKSTDKIVNVVSLIDLFTPDEIANHVSSLRKESAQIPSKEETTIDENTCQLCERNNLHFAPAPVYCLYCCIRIRRNTPYFCRKEGDGQPCFCSGCYKKAKGGKITFNGTSISKKTFEKMKNDQVLGEEWVECNKCKRWQHQICALYNNKRDSDHSAEYICVCCLKEMDNGMHVPLPKTSICGAKDLPRTILSDHLEKRLFKSLMKERPDRENVVENENLDEVFAAESLSIREVLSVDKQLEGKKQFLDIIPEENYPAEFSYRSRVILLFQKIEGAAICIFGMYVQEYGSECGNPNQRCVYISYLDSVKYFRPEKVTISGQALRTFVYHDILIGYLDFCKKRGFTTCHIWACAPSKGDDYILYCHPEEQKTPKNDKLRSWYLSMLSKAAEENIVVGLTNLYDHFFVPTEKSDSKVTAARLPYFDGDYWCSKAIKEAMKIEKASGGDYAKLLKKQVPNRSLKAMGHNNPSKDTAKDILVMQNLDQNIMPEKENFMIVHLQHSCVHCREVIMSGKRWFCTECKKFQECERCHSSDLHTTKNGEVHTLCEAVVDDIPSNTNHNDTILESALFENRNNFLYFCLKNKLQFDTLRRAKYSSMMILYHINNPTWIMNFGTCSICHIYQEFEKCWKCEICSECTICSACYNDRGADCHEHKLTEKKSTELCQYENQDRDADCHEEKSTEKKLCQSEIQDRGADCHEHKSTEKKLCQSEIQDRGADCQLTEKKSTELYQSENQDNRGADFHEHKSNEKKSSLCQSEFHDRGADCHEHNDNQHLYLDSQKSNQNMTMKLLEVLKHASQCLPTKSEPCLNSNCSQMKKLFSHASKCKTGASGGCKHCKKTWFILNAHYKDCKDPECKTPRCSDMKMHAMSKAKNSAS